MSGGLKNLFSKVTDTIGLTDSAALEAQQRQYEEQQKQLAAQAQLSKLLRVAVLVKPCF